MVPTWAVNVHIVIGRSTLQQLRLALRWKRTSRKRMLWVCSFRECNFAPKSHRVDLFCYEESKSKQIIAKQTRVVFAILYAKSCPANPISLFEEKQKQLLRRTLFPVKNHPKTTKQP